ncbi:MAG TPA: tetratricopeptide repeat protein [Pseudomonadales bacterium]
MNEASNVFEVSPQTFQTDVIDRSKQVPVLLLFWAAQVAPSAQTRDTLTRLAAQFQGKVAIGLVDVARDQTLAQHLRIQGLPSIRVVRDGQLVDQIDGPQPEATLRALLDQLTQSPADMLREQLDVLLERGEYDMALAMLQRAISDEPTNQAFRVELADVLVIQHQLDEARTVLAGIPEDTEGRDRPAIRLEIAEEAAGMGSAEALAARIESDPDDLDARYALAVVLADQRRYQEALDQAMSILRQDRSFRDDLGRLTMIRIFSLLGKGSDLATAYRRRMFNFMH